MFTIKEIAKAINCIEIYNDADIQINSVKRIDDVNFDKNSIAWCSDKNGDLLNSISIGTIIISRKLYLEKKINISSQVCILIADNPRTAFSQMLNTFFLPKYDQTLTNAYLRSCQTCTI